MSVRYVLKYACVSEAELDLNIYTGWKLFILYPKHLYILASFLCLFDIYDESLIVKKLKLTLRISQQFK